VSLDKVRKSIIKIEKKIPESFVYKIEVGFLEKNQWFRWQKSRFLNNWQKMKKIRFCDRIVWERYMQTCYKNCKNRC